MHAIRRLAPIVALMLLPWSIAEAQAPAESITVIGGIPIGLIDQPRMQKELGLAPAQVARAEAASRTARDRLRGARKQEQQEIAVAYQKEMSALLKPEQTRRVREVTLQMRGAEAFRDPAIRATLKLTAAQGEMADAIWARMYKRIEREVLPLARDPAKRQEVQDRIMKIRGEVMVEMVGISEEGQKREWAAMLGEPLDPAQGGAAAER